MRVNNIKFFSRGECNYSVFNLYAFILISPMIKTVL